MLQKLLKKEVEVPEEEEKEREAVQIFQMLYLQPPRALGKELPEGAKKRD